MAVSSVPEVLNVLLTASSAEKKRSTRGPPLRACAPADVRASTRPCAADIFFVCAHLLSRATDDGHHQESIDDVGPGVRLLGAAPPARRRALLSSVPAGLQQQPGLRVDLPGLVTGHFQCKKTQPSPPFNE